MSLMISVSGIRGIVGKTMTPQVASEYAAALGTYLSGGLVVLGRDSRPSGPQLRDAIVEALLRCGCPVIDLGIVTTPGAALMVQRHSAAGGLVITASHNTSEWNGLKFLTPEGVAPPIERAREIWNIRDQRAFSFVADSKSGYLTEDFSTHEQHIAAVLSLVDPESIARLRFKVVLDSISGAGCVAGRILLHAIECGFVHLNGDPTGEFSHLPEPVEQNLGDLCAAVRKQGADLGFAQDPDGDRLAVVDETGRYLGEEYTLALAAKYLFAKRRGPAAANLSTSRMIDRLAEAAGPPCAVHRTPVGEANVVVGMKQHNCLFGGEGNGGVIDPRVVPVRDSFVAMALILQLLADEQRPLSSIVDSIPRYTMVKQKLQCALDRIADVLQAVKLAFADEQINEQDGVRIDWPEGWVHLRASNTEPIMRLIAEAVDQSVAQSLIARIRKVVNPLLH